MTGAASGRWRRADWVRTASLAAVAGSAAVLSYATLRDVAAHAGFPAWATWFYPVALDGTIVGASRTWRDATLSRRTRSLAAAVTLGAICAGIAGFVSEHAAQGPVAVGFSALIPAALAAVLVLTSWASTDRRDHAAATEDLRDATELRQAAQQERDAAMAARHELEATPRRTATRKPRQVADAPAARAQAEQDASAPPGGPEARRQWVRDRLAAGTPTVGADVDNRFGAPRNGARIVRQVERELNKSPRLAVAE